MRDKKQLLPLLAATLLLVGVLCLIRYGSSLPPATPDDPPDTPVDTPDVPDEPDDPAQPDEPAYEYACDVSAYINAIMQSYETLLVNKTHGLDAAYVPQQLVYLDAVDTIGQKQIQLEATAAAALKAMLLCMRADGITDTYVTSGYRSYSYQSTLYNFYFQTESQGLSENAYAHFGEAYIEANYLSQNVYALTPEDAWAVVQSYSAAPGHSEHQSGLCVDFMTIHMTDLNRTFENTAAFDWLQENACRFGFILRYPKHLQSVTGYAYEPWHYRFVGLEAAMAIAENDLTLEQYLEAIHTAGNAK